MEQNEKTDQSAIVIWVTALEGASFETYRTNSDAGAEIHLPMTPAELENELAREAAREGVEPKSLCLCGWKYLGRFAPFEWLPLNEIGTAEDANLLAAAIMRDPDNGGSIWLPAAFYDFDLRTADQLKEVLEEVRSEWWQDWQTADEFDQISYKLFAAEC